METGNSRGCKTCRHIKTTNTFRSSVTRKSYKVHTSANCKTKGTIYMIQCRKCPKQYVGLTKNALHIRLNGASKTRRFRNQWLSTFNRRGHSMEDLTIMVIEKMPDMFFSFNFCTYEDLGGFEVLYIHEMINFEYRSLH